MKILPAELEDCDEIIQLQRLAYESEAKLYNDWMLPPIVQTSDALRQEFSTGLMLKAMKEKKVIGSVRAKLIDKTCHISRLIVHPEQQRQGIGAQLLDNIEQHFTQATQYTLFTGSRSKSNIRFYLANNYRISHTEKLTEKITLVYFIKNKNL